MTNWPKGTRLKFKVPANETEASERFIVVEDRDTRVAVADETHYRAFTILPITVYAKDDMEVCE